MNMQSKHAAHANKLEAYKSGHREPEIARAAVSLAKQGMQQEMHPLQMQPMQPMPAH